MKKAMLILAFLPAMLACDDIFEKDITKKEVSVIAPVNGITVKAGQVTFLWREVENASAYHLRIIGGTFADAGLPVIDTVMYNDSTGVRRSHRLHLDEGEYRWSISALNSTYSTEESVFTLYVAGDRPRNISKEEITVTAPCDGAELGPGEIAFSWKEVAGANFYRFTLVSPEFGSASKVIVETVLHKEEGMANSIYKAEITELGNYQWRISAGNQIYETTAKVSSFSIPAPVPEDISGLTVEVVSPADSAETGSDSITFLWKEIAGAASYHLTVVAPSFTSSHTVIADKVLDITQERDHPTSHTADIPAGKYEWMITANNSRYRTKERIRSLTVTEPEGSEDISDATVDVIVPYNGAVIEEPGGVTFLWRGLKGATSYHITIVGPDFRNATVVIADEIVPGRSFKANIPAGSYQWSLRAKNSKYETAEQVFSFEVAGSAESENL